ncbi:transporter substrate-binding domain-containing protein [Stutzerimonas stutzeri]|uniref:transporter substrate-binding domain-containing protein n=1 Tax=Stutzerimonas sp. S1 TaxID=3030652 RepID=UPI00222588C0|nr:transporter substrate-binding domain-containing protein [Stutzerimonas sp. S1]MCW3148237.1 transporter substrate-binding domain-containing protein [Stutzerimonas sp. S1]
MLSSVARAALLSACCLPALAFGDPLRVVPVGEYRALSSSAAASFDTVFSVALVEALDRTWVRGSAATAADLVVGEGVDGTVYYRTGTTALVATEDRALDWPQLRGEPVCVVAGNPRAAMVKARFGVFPRFYPSAAHALIGLKLGECRAVVEDARLLEALSVLPEWRRYKRILPRLPEAELAFSVEAKEQGLQVEINDLLRRWESNGRLAELAQLAIDEVAFQAYVLADTLDCH